ncbi:MAG: FAD-dependent monooxygenase [Undibacterium sp.]|nr:FAD-dependent monooxygenase [Undibacterium sp.]
MNSFIPFIICGAGPVGQALALLLHKAGIAAQDILLIDAKTGEAAQQDHRSIALSHGSQQILLSISAPTSHTTEIREIHISRRGHFGRCMIKASDYQLKAMGYVARYGAILQPLEEALTRANIKILRPVQVARVEENEQLVTLHLAEQEPIQCQVFIQAEGGTFDTQATTASSHPYQQTAIISHVHCSAAIMGRAFERFTEQGPLALLPQDDGYALVWCVESEQAQALIALDDATFLAALQNTFGNRLGQFLSATPRHHFALGLNCQNHASTRTVRIGNAAQTLHPVAGQGLNLGLRDAHVLAEQLARTNPLSAAEIQIALQAYLRLRKDDRLSTIKITDTMAKIFSHENANQIGLGLSLSLLDFFKPAKKILAEQMMFGWRV